MRTRNDGTRVAAAAVLALSLSGCGNAQAEGDKPGTTASTGGVSMPKTDRITMADFKKLQATNDVVIIDVRASDAYVAGHIPGALSIPEESITAATAEKLKGMGKPIAAYCS